MRRALLAVAAVVLLQAPALAENPVFDAEDDADVAAALAEAQEVQGVCYGYVLTVADGDGGRYAGSYASSSTGAGQPLLRGPACTRGVVELIARIGYTSSFSEAEDSASWQLSTTVDGLTIDDVERASGTSASDLLDDGGSETALLNAVLSLPGLATEVGGVPPVVLEENTEPLPDDARATGTPGSDWLRENGVLLGLCVAAVGGGLVALLAARRPARPTGALQEPPRTFGPRPRATPPIRPTDQTWSDT